MSQSADTADADADEDVDVVLESICFSCPPSEGQNFDLAKYIVSRTRYEYSMQYIVSYDTMYCF
jgi:hypothetical protein